MDNREILDHLEKIVAFETVSRHPSLHQAAQALNISQPSLSVKIRQVEQILGAPLLTRSTKGIQLSEKGHIVVNYVREIARLTNELRVSLTSHEDQYRGVVRLGVYESIARYFWPGFSRHLSRECPGLKIQISTGRSSTLIRKLLDQGLDVALTIEAPFDSRLATTDLYQDSFSLFASAPLLKSLGVAVRPGSASLLPSEALSSAPFICFADALAESGRPLIQEVTRLGLDHENISEVESFEVALEFCHQGLGVAVLPNRVAQRSLGTGHLHRVRVHGVKTTDFSKHRICASTLKANQHHPASSALIREIREQTRRPQT